jgi:leader peptidase (prepilin peptidase) / N-methyltransferase
MFLPYLELLFAFIVGWLLGSLVNYLSDVLPYFRGLARPPCLACGVPAAMPQYWLFPAACRQCGKRRGWRSLVVWIVFAVASVYLWLNPPDGLGFALAMLLLAYFGLVTVIDIEHRLILHVVSLAGAFLALAVGLWLHGWLATLLGGLAGFGVMLGLHLLGRGFIRLSGRLRGHPVGEEDDALGFGDVNLSGVIGLLLGWPGIVAGLVLTILLGGLASLLALAVSALRGKYDPGLALPYGPFIAASAIYLLFTR